MHSEERAAMTDSPQLSALAQELAARCAAILEPQDWDRIVIALGEMHDQLLEDIPDEGEFDLLFPDVVAGLIDRLGNTPVQCRPQAQVYISSADEDHRARARAWLQENPS